MKTQITAELLWLVHRAALGGVSAATGDKLPETLDENKIHAVKLSHYGMALVMARLAGHADPKSPDGMTYDDRTLVCQRLDAARLLPDLVPAIDGNTIGALVDRVLNPPTMGMGGGSKTEEAAQDRHRAECHAALQLALMNYTDSASQTVLRALGTILWCKPQDVAAELKSLDEGLRLLAKSGEAFGSDTKQKAADAMLTYIADNVRNPEIAEFAQLARAFNDVCQGLAASPPVTLEAIAEPVRTEPRVGVTIWDFNALTQREVAMLAEARGVLQPRSLRDCSDDELAAECERRGMAGMAHVAVVVPGTPDSSCDQAPEPSLVTAAKSAPLSPVSDAENARLDALASSPMWVSDDEIHASIPTIDPEQEAAIATLERAIAAKSLDVPGIGTASILTHGTSCKESFPPYRTTTLTIAFRHRA